MLTCLRRADVQVLITSSPQVQNPCQCDPSVWHNIWSHGRCLQSWCPDGLHVYRNTPSLHNGVCLCYHSQIQTGSTRSPAIESQLKSHFQTDADVLFAKERKIEIVEVKVSSLWPQLIGYYIFSRPDFGKIFSTPEVQLCQPPLHQMWLPQLLFSLVKLNSV